MSWFRLGFVCVAFFLYLNYSFAEDEKVVHYTTETFPNEVPKNNHFIMFYAPWCGYCKRLHPVWEQLADMLNNDPESEITIGKVDCTVDRDLCAEHDVTGYPTLKYYKQGGIDGVKFRGTRDLPSFTSFINEQLGKTSGEPTPSAPLKENGLTELTESSFNEHAQKGTFFIKFYAPWCGHCQKLAPTWEDLAKFFENDPKIEIAKLDCTTQRNVCNNLEIKGYPTLLWMQDGKVVEKYQGPRTELDLKSYVNKMLGDKESKAEEEGENVGGMVTLNSENFHQGISQGLSFVKFFAPWCGHCKRLAPIWSELNKKVAGLSNTRLVKVDCTQENSKELCNEQEVEGFPTLYLYKNGEKISEYNGSRNLEDMYDFLAKHFSHDEL